jgi:hypothetical protein
MRVEAVDNTEAARSTTLKQRIRRRRQQDRRRQDSRVDEKNASSRVKTLTKNLIRLLSVHDLEGNGFQIPVVPVADARRRSGWRRSQRHDSSKHMQNLTRGLGGMASSKGWQAPYIGFFNPWSLAPFRSIIVILL